jgi:hypothetical protein
VFGKRHEITGNEKRRSRFGSRLAALQYCPEIRFEEMRFCSLRQLWSDLLEPGFWIVSGSPTILSVRGSALEWVLHAIGHFR